MARRSAAVASSSWILSPFWDGALFIGAPVVSIAAFVPLRGYFSSVDIAVFLLAFFTFGHHLPGFIRAYGDRELFGRYKWRFLLAPPIIFLTALWFDLRDLHGLVILVAAWDIWHVLMQHYGFMRIYDAKQGAVTPVISRLDWAVSISWYITLISASPHYRHNLLNRAYAAGLPLISPGVVQGLDIGLMACTAILTLLYTGYHLHRWRRGLPVSLRKLTLLGVFLAATYYLYVYLDDFLVGFTVWSAFHCIQYYGIVWAFNRNRVARESPVRAFVRFLFRPRIGLAILYMGLIFAYGSINYLVGFFSGEEVRRLLLAFVFTSNALHYYYDGFIWKVREPQTRNYLNISPAKILPGASGRRWPARPGLVQAGYLSAIVLALVAFESWRPRDPLQMARFLVGATPRVGEAHFDLGDALVAQRKLDEAVEAYRTAARLLPDSSEVRHNLGTALYEQGRLDEAIAAYREGLTIHVASLEKARKTASSVLLPGFGSRHAGALDAVHNNLGDALSRKGLHAEAMERYRRALELNPRSVRALTNLGATLAEQGRFEEGKRELEKALQVDPRFGGAHVNLAAILAHLGQTERALFHYEMALATGDEDDRAAARAAIAGLQPGR